MLVNSAKKEQQIAAINLHGLMLFHLVEFACGDENALAKLIALRDKLDEKQSAATNITIERGDEKPAPIVPATTGNLLQMPPVVYSTIPQDSKCECEMAVKIEGHGHECSVCGKYAGENYYVYQGTPEATAIMRGEEVPIENWHEPDIEPTFPAPTPADPKPQGNFVPEPATFLPASEDFDAEEIA